MRHADDQYPSAQVTATANGVMVLQLFTDVNGEARAVWTLGGAAGCGNNRVCVTGAGLSNSVFFCASAAPAPAKQINIGTGNNQKAETGAFVAEPLRAWVSDSCNGIEGIPVTFTVVQGGGHLYANSLSAGGEVRGEGAVSTSHGSTVLTIPTTRTGHAEALFQLGPDPGQNIIEATYPGNPGLPATFIVYGVARDPSRPTSFGGLVLDNTSSPIGHAHCELMLYDKWSINAEMNVLGVDDDDLPHQTFLEEKCTIQTWYWPEIAEQPPVFSRHPSSVTSAAGVAVTLEASTSGSPEPFYQWFQNGIGIPFQTRPTLTLTLGSGATGTYHVIARNRLGWVRSNAATVSMLPPSPPPGMVYIPPGYRYRLPTEAEWEYACRAGTASAVHYGSALRSWMANFYGLSEYDASVGIISNPSDTYLGRTTEAGSYAPNAFGLYDMHGNVWEWCQDFYGTYPTTPVVDPQGPGSGNLRVCRGGSWSRNGGYPFGRYIFLGFRVVLAPSQL